MLICVLIIIAIYIFYHIYIGYQLVYESSHPKRSDILYQPNIPYKYEKFNFESKDNLVLVGIVYLPLKESKGTIIASHYLGGSKFSIYNSIEPLLDEGFTVVSYDYPNHGESQDRRGNKYTLEDDMKRFICEIKKQGVKGPFGTYGFSMGATVAISAIDNLDGIKAIVLDSGPLIYVHDYFKYILRIKNIYNVITKYVFLKYYLDIIGFVRMRRRMIRRCKSMRNYNILMFHCKNDIVIPYINAEYTRELLNLNNVKLVSVQKGYHLTNRVVLGKLYDDLVVTFFRKYLK